MIRFNNPDDGFTIAAAAGTVFNPAVDVCIARVEGEELYGGVLLNGYTGASINTHMAGFRQAWSNRDHLWVVFDYCFNQLGCKKVFGQIPANNQRALEVDLKLGFKIEARIQDVFPGGEDLIVVSMSREDCRWLKLKPRSLQSNRETA